MDGSRGRADDRDRLGFDETADWLRAALGGFVPQPVARRAIAASVTADRAVIRPGETATIDVEFRNRLPVPVTVETPRRRLWGWTVDGRLAASDETPYTRPAGGALTFRGGERKRFTRRWDGRFAVDGERWVDAEPGTYDVRAFLATADRTPAATTTVEVRR